MLQQGGIYPQARPLEIVRLYASFFRDPMDPAALLGQVGLGGVRRPYRVLSGGERQRLGLALALVGRPEVAILDEPTAGMDPAAKASTRAMIAGLRADGVTILLTTHDLADAETVADRVAIMDQGRLVALGSPDELTSGGRPIVRFRLARPLTPGERTGLEAALGMTPIPDESAAVRATAVHGEPEAATRFRLDVTEPSPNMVVRLATWCAVQGMPLVELRVGSQSLEERYLELVGEGARQ